LADGHCVRIGLSLLLLMDSTQHIRLEISFLLTLHLHTTAQRPGWVEKGDDCAGHRKVAELLAEQVESANLILVNKIDMASKEEIDVTTKVARALNQKATLFEVEFGKVRPQEILEMGTKGVMTDPMDNVKEEKKEKKSSKKEAKSSHSHSHDHDCEEPDCTDASHSHSHDDHAKAAACEEPDCTDESHDHSHSHDHGCEEPACTDTSHSHSHDHAEDAAACIDPGCTDDHEHSHSHATSTDNLGITNFVYKGTQ